MENRDFYAEAITLVNLIFTECSRYGENPILSEEEQDDLIEVVKNHLEKQNQ